MASSKLVSALLLLATINAAAAQATWCVARSDATSQALQLALDYACGAGADCLSLQPNGLCFLPNTMQAHASYAFNSFYQIKSRAPGSCDFGGTATIAQSDPSYGSCVYPSSSSTAGGSTTPTTPSMNTPNTPSSPTTTTPVSGMGGNDGLTPGMDTPFPDNTKSRAPQEAMATWFLVFLSFLIMSLIIS